eukprot:1003805-Rhodomonas_salina.1
MQRRGLPGGLGAGVQRRRLVQETPRDVQRRWRIPERCCALPGGEGAVQGGHGHVRVQRERETEKER